MGKSLEKQVRDLEVENKSLKDKIIDLEWNIDNLEEDLQRAIEEDTVLPYVSKYIDVDRLLEQENLSKTAYQINDISDYQEWDSDSIASRQTRLADTAVLVWRID